MKNKAKAFRMVVANSVLVILLGGILFFSLSGGSIYAGGNNKPLYKGVSDDKVSLMVNVYWGTEYIDSMLETLKKHDAKTTFFVGGSWVKDNEAVLKKIYADGHEIANHGYFHKSHDKISAARNRDEIMSTHGLVKEVLGIDMNLFAPPSGAFNDITLDVASDLGYTTIMWSYDTVDWRDKDVSLIYKRATKNTRGGDLILMHPTACTADALDNIIVTLKEKGLKVVPVSEVIGVAE